ncbi:MAG TPA: type II toxin-antitoxin system prevent-host-death family antitoxin [Gemmatimonadaceae bacterium]|nr:type II toxin-antitoxin system prevent-host-death family antitoxin [Gemmatimonadaceae bacterium]
MTVVTVHVAKTNLSKLIERVCAGEEVVIARGSEPVVRLVPVAQEPPRRRFGALKGRLRVPEEFFEPLPAEELAGWEP